MNLYGHLCEHRTRKLDSWANGAQGFGLFMCHYAHTAGSAKECAIRRDNIHVIFCSLFQVIHPFPDGCNLLIIQVEVNTTQDVGGVVNPVPAQSFASRSITASRSRQEYMNRANQTALRARRRPTTTGSGCGSVPIRCTSVRIGLRPAEAGLHLAGAFPLPTAKCVSQGMHVRTNTANPLQQVDILSPIAPLSAAFSTPRWTYPRRTGRASDDLTIDRELEMPRFLQGRDVAGRSGR